MKAFFVISLKGSLCNLPKYTLVYARCVFYSPVHKERGEFHWFSVRYRDFAAQIVHIAILYSTCFILWFHAKDGACLDKLNSE